MKYIRLQNWPEIKSWDLHFADDSHYDTCFEESVSVTKPDGQPLLVLIKEGLTKPNTALAWSVLKKLNLSSDNRGSAAGLQNIKRMRKDGTQSNTIRARKGWEVYSGTIGHFERTVRLPYCRACQWNLDNPEKFARIVPIAQEVNELFKTHIPERYAVQASYAEKTNPAFLVPGTVFTTLTINKNFRTAYHLDAGDLKAGFSCMSVIRQGAYTGARLVLPNWRIAVDLGNRDVVMFDAHEWHGNTQFVALSKDAVRCSVVHYYREKMIGCLSPKEEAEQAKNRKLGQPLWPDKEK